MPHEWQYSGDMHREEGGLYWREDGSDDYVRAVRITPCSDAGGPDNLFVIEQGSIYLPEDETRRNSALATIGWFDESDPDPAHYRRCLVDAFLAYHGMENDVWNGSIVLRIGRAQESRGWSPEADIVKPHNLNLQRFVEGEYLD
jgi:hypothetical protein